MATGTPDVSPLVAVGRQLTGLVPLLALVTRMRWLLCGVGALQACAPMLSEGIQPADLVRFSAAGAWIIHGRLDQVYASSWMQAGPLELLASWALFPFGDQHRTEYVSAGLFGQVWLRLAVGAALVAGAMLLVRYLRSVHGQARCAPLELLAGLTAVLVAVPYHFWVGGHLAQTGVPPAWILGASLVVRGRTRTGGLVIGLSAAWEPWGVLAAGVLLAERRPARLVLGCTALALGALVCYLPFVATGRFALFGLDWPIVPNTLIARLFPGTTEFSWPLRLLQGTAAGLAGATVAYALGHRRDLIWLGPLAVLVVRLLLDPLLLSYYWGPFLIAVPVGVGLLHRGCSLLRVALVAALAAVPLIHFRSGLDHDLLLLSGALLLIAALTIVLRREEPASAGGPDHLVAGHLEPGHHPADLPVGGEHGGHRPVAGQLGEGGPGRPHQAEA